jgi:hypothetical protein
MLLATIRKWFTLAIMSIRTFLRWPVLLLMLLFALLFAFVPIQGLLKAHAASLPGGMWVSPTTDNNVYVAGTWYTIKARAYPTNPGDPAIDHVNFTLETGGNWYILCSPTQPDTGTADTYSCSTDFRQQGVYPDGSIQLSFDVYASDGGVNKAPNGVRNEQVNSAKANNAITWARSLLNTSPPQYYGFCEVFVENAYGNYGGTSTGGYLTAQDAFNVLHTSTSWSPDIGALVWFTPETENQMAGHVGIYIGNGQFISAIEGSPVVQINTLQEWSTHAPYEGWADAPSDWPGR